MRILAGLRFTRCMRSHGHPSHENGGVGTRAEIALLWATSDTLGAAVQAGANTRETSFQNCDLHPANAGAGLAMRGDRSGRLYLCTRLSESAPPVAVAPAQKRNAAGWPC
jgi:hypothetical protein